MRQLSKTQEECLSDVNNTWQSAYGLSYRVNTLYVLERSGLVERKENSYMRLYDENIRIEWRLTDAGAMMKLKLARGIEAKEALSDD